MHWPAVTMCASSAAPSTRTSPKAWGAGLAIRGGVAVVDCIFTRNYAGPDFFGVETYGGAGLYVEGENSVSGCLFAHNRAEGPGAALR